MKHPIFTCCLVVLIGISMTCFFSQICWSKAQEIDGSSCDVKCADSNSTAPGTLKSCMCDDKCSQYGDCCIDVYRIPPNVTSFPSCVRLPDGFYFVNRTCTSKKNDFKAKCQGSFNYAKQVGQKLLKSKVPVTDLTTGITYGNIFCARCNRRPDQNIQFWNMSVTCETVSGILTFYNTTRRNFSVVLSNGAVNLTFNNTLKLWMVKVANGTENCSIVPKLPDVLKSYPRPCFANLTKSCKFSWSNTNVSSRCLAYQSVVQDMGGIMYRNRHCAECNEVPEGNLTCIRIGRLSAPALASFPAKKKVLALSTRKPAIRWSISTRHPLVTPTRPLNDTQRHYIVVDFSSGCFAFLKSANFTRITAETVHYTTFNRSYVRNKSHYGGQTTKVCHFSRRKKDVFPGYGTFVASAGSILFILLQVPQVWKFCFQTFMWTLNQKNMISYTVALILGNVGMLLNSFKSVETFAAFCSYADLLTYFGFLSSFFWLLSMTFEMSCTVWTAGGNFAEITGIKEEKRFLIYSTLGWTPAAVITSVMALLSPRLDDGTCAYTGDGVFLLFFALPLTVTTSVNLAFYFYSAFVVYMSSKTAEKLSATGVQFEFHASLVLTTSLMWFVILLAMYYHSVVSLIVFAIFNIVSGLLVYVISSPDNYILNFVYTVMEPKKVGIKEPNDLIKEEAQ